MIGGLLESRKRKRGAPWLKLRTSFINGSIRKLSSHLLQEKAFPPSSTNRKFRFPTSTKTYSTKSKCLRGPNFPHLIEKGGFESKSRIKLETAPPLDNSSVIQGPELCKKAKQGIAYINFMKVL